MHRTIGMVNENTPFVGSETLVQPVQRNSQSASGGASGIRNSFVDSDGFEIILTKSQKQNWR